MAEVEVEDCRNRLDGMVNVASKRCEFEGCDTQPHYNYIGEIKGMYCGKHRLDGMVNIVDKRCEFEGCDTRPYYNYIGETKGLYCGKHRLDGMVNVVSKRCKFEGCDTQPHYNYIGETKGLYCEKHKLDGMVNVVDKRCEFIGCKKKATYGLIGNSPSYCAKHADKRTMLYRPNHRCSIRNCHELAIYGDKKPTHCETHKTESEHSFLISTCKSCHFQAIIVDNEGYCFFCNPETIKSVRLAKQNKVSDFLGRHFELESIDTIIDSSCGRERPDIVLNPESGFFKIVVEVDEYQHKGRPQFCACQRMVNVGEIFQMPTLFIDIIRMNTRHLI